MTRVGEVLVDLWIVVFILVFGVWAPLVYVVRSWRRARALRRDRKMIERLLAEVREQHR